ncbi:MAG: response regulator [Desulfobulbaceae bacterium]|nr:response regulator [Desulfobulbaceae bacterium]
MKTQDYRILIIDDQVANLKVLLSFLEEQHFDVRIAETGKRALTVLENYSPDLILLDVMMPGMDGFETCRRIKANKETAAIPVIFMTVLDSIEDKIVGFEAGGVDYITKPFQQLEVVTRMNTHLRLRRQQLELEQALAEVKQLSGLLPICSFCKQIRNDKGDWQQIEQYISNHSEAEFSHSLCPDCVEQHYGHLYRDKKKMRKDG